MEEIDLKEFLKYLRKYVWMMLVAVFVLVSAISFYDLNIKTKNILKSRNDKEKSQ